ncbi:MAG TPA: hypothetical protein VM409_00370 [Chloroflexia bacterium]|nr:hypothetical protein [Chloroflexia bacterium]
MKRNLYLAVLALVLLGVAMASVLATRQLPSTSSKTPTLAHDANLPEAVTPSATVAPLERWIKYASELTPPVDMRAAEQLPPYPGAEDVKVIGTGFHNQPAKLQFYTDDPLWEVGQYYSIVLAKIGWLESQGGWSDKATIAQGFIWSDSLDNLYLLTASVLISDGCLIDPYGDMTDTNMIKKRCVDIELLRQPFASRVPLYPGAHDVQVLNKPVEYRPPYITRTTKYVASASLQEIENFYRTTLANNGWSDDIEVIGTPPGSILTGVVFIDGTRADPQGGQPPRVVISAKQTDSGGSEVSVLAQGPDLEVSSP